MRLLLDEKLKIIDEILAAIFLSNFPEYPIKICPKKTSTRYILNYYCRMIFLEII